MSASVKAMARMQRQDKKHPLWFLPSRESVIKFFSPNFILAIACAGISAGSSLSLMLPMLRESHSSGGDWFWMLALSSGCAAASRTTLFGATNTDHLTAFKKDKRGGVSSYIFSILCACWMIVSAAIIIKNTWACDYVGRADGCDFVCTRCLNFTPPCREPNQLTMLMYTRYGLEPGSNISIELYNRTWQMDPQPSVSVGFRYYDVKQPQNSGETVYKYRLVPSHVRARQKAEAAIVIIDDDTVVLGPGENNAEQLKIEREAEEAQRPAWQFTLFEVGAEIEYLDQDPVTGFQKWSPGLVHSYAQARATARWDDNNENNENNGSKFLRATLTHRRIPPNTEFSLTVGMGNSQAVHVPTHLQRLSNEEIRRDYEPIPTTPTRTPTPFPTTVDRKTPSPTPYSCQCSDSCRDYKDGRDALFLKNATVFDPTNSNGKFHLKSGDIKDCYCSQPPMVKCWKNPTCLRTYVIDVVLGMSGTIARTSEYTVSNQDLVFDYAMWRYKSEKLTFGAMCDAGSDCSDCGPTTFQQPAPGRTCFDSTPSPTPFPSRRPGLGQVRIWTAQGTFQESAAVEANSVSYSGQQHVCFKAHWIAWNLSWPIVACFVSLLLLRRSTLRIAILKATKFVIYPVDMSTWKLTDLSAQRRTMGASLADLRNNPTVTLRHDDAGRGEQR